jgi:hypothetical protein
MIIEKKRLLYILNNEDYSFIDKIIYSDTINEFISKINPKNKEEFENIIKYSQIYINIIKKDCKYSIEIHNKINEMIKKNNINI